MAATEYENRGFVNVCNGLLWNWRLEFNKRFFNYLDCKNFNDI